MCFKQWQSWPGMFTQTGSPPEPKAWFEVPTVAELVCRSWKQPGGGAWQAVQAAGLPEGEPGDPHRRHSPLILGFSLLHGRPAVQPGEPCGDRAFIAIRHD